jgi:phage minor structural protein
MIPILYEATETAFTSNGVCRLPDCGICQVTEERNGVYECTFTYPTSGAHYGDIKEGRIIFCTHDETGRAQPFDIYARSEPIDGVVTFYAHHISYRLGRVILQPMTATSCAAALNAITSHTYNSCPFTFWTDKTNAGSFTTHAPKPVKEVLGGSQGSILDVFGKGEYEWDRFDVKLYLNRGTTTDVTIRYGVNMTGYSRDLNYSSAYNACVPYWLDSETNELITPGVVYAEGYDASSAEPVVMDLSDAFENAPTQQQLIDEAEARMTSNQSWLPSDNITVSFVPLWQTEEYASVAPLQRVRLCDKVNVVYGPGAVEIKGVQVIRTVYNVLLDRYDSMELGTARATFEALLKADITEAVFEDVPTKSFLQEAIDYATEMITGNTGGYVVLHKDATTGEPYELLILDEPDIGDATHVWRWNSGGLGHSSNGYNGPYDDVAITRDGKINASAIAVGELNAALIKAGVLSDAAGKNTWDLTSGALNMTTGSINIGNGNFKVTNGGVMSCKGASVEGNFTTTGPSGVMPIYINNGMIKSTYGQALISFGSDLEGVNNEMLTLKGRIAFDSGMFYIIDGTTYYKTQNYNITVAEPGGFSTELVFRNGLLVGYKSN